VSSPLRLQADIPFTDQMHSYKTDVKIRFVTEELGFESDEECARFICEYGGHVYLEEGSEVKLLTAKALNFFDPAKDAAFKKVDIKGQI